MAFRTSRMSFLAAARRDDLSIGDRAALLGCSRATFGSYAKTFGVKLPPWKHGRSPPGPRSCLTLPDGSTHREIMHGWETTGINGLLSGAPSMVIVRALIKLNGIKQNPYNDRPSARRNAEYSAHM